MSNASCVFRGCKRLADFIGGTFVDECMPVMGGVGLSLRRVQPQPAHRLLAARKEIREDRRKY